MTTIVEDPVLSLLTNRQGLFQVDDTLYQFTPTRVRRIEFTLGEDDLETTLSFIDVAAVDEG